LFSGEDALAAGGTATNFQSNQGESLMDFREYHTSQMNMHVLLMGKEEQFLHAIDLYRNQGPSRRQRLLRWVGRELESLGERLQERYGSEVRADRYGRMAQ
jgi:hypothetical protein